MKRNITFVLAVLLLLNLFAACADGSTVDGSTTNGNASDSSSSDSSSESSSSESSGTEEESNSFSETGVLNMAFDNDYGSFDNFGTPWATGTYRYGMVFDSLIRQEAGTDTFNGH